MACARDVGDVVSVSTVDISIAKSSLKVTTIELKRALSVIVINQKEKTGVPSYEKSCITKAKSTRNHMDFMDLR
jgi:hypothetical protein